MAMFGTRSTPRDLVRLFKPMATDEECDHLLWEHSSFPFGSINDWLGQVRDNLEEPCPEEPCPR